MVCIAARARLDDLIVIVCRSRTQDALMRCQGSDDAVLRDKLQLTSQFAHHSAFWNTPHSSFLRAFSTKSQQWDVALRKVLCVRGETDGGPRRSSSGPS